MANTHGHARMHTQLLPQRAAQRISELNLFLYLRISGVSLTGRVLVGLTLTMEPFLTSSFSCSKREPRPTTPTNHTAERHRVICQKHIHSHQKKKESQVYAAEFIFLLRSVVLFSSKRVEESLEQNIQLWGKENVIL